MQRLVLACLLLISLTLPGRAQTGTYYVASSGSDSTGNGSAAQPWATISHAVTVVPDGSLVVVQPGTYTGEVLLNRAFGTGIAIRSEAPYQARLRHSATVVKSFYGRNITLEGFDIAHSPGAGPLVIQIQDLRGPQPGCADGDCVRGITLRDNLIHDSADNDLLKVNNGAADVRITGNLFYNQAGSDEHIDINSVTDVIVEDNVFFNTRDLDTSSFIVIKDSNGSSDANLGSRTITVRRNIFLNWQGSSGSNFVLIGEDGQNYFEADGVLVENNLMLGNASDEMRAAVGVKGSQNIVFRNNTIVGDLPALAYAFRINREGSNLVNANVRFYNNIWADPTGTMGADASGGGNDFSDGTPGEVTGLVLARNLYWNGGQPIPPGDQVNPNTADAGRVIADPGLAGQAGLLLPTWAGTAFASGSATIRNEFVRLVRAYGTPALTSPVRDAADSGQAPADDILGNPRSDPDLGAVELAPDGPPSTPPPTLTERLYLPSLRR
jgi:hypothetical protein